MGGVVAIAYAAAVNQQDASLRAAAAGDANDPAKAPPPSSLADRGIHSWVNSWVVASVTAEGPNRDPLRVGYEYAHPGWCPDLGGRWSFWAGSPSVRILPR